MASGRDGNRAAERGVEPEAAATAMKGYRGFGQKLHHGVPPWVDTDNVFHVRIRSEDSQLTDPAVAEKLLTSVRFYEEKKRWHVLLCVLMPDHLHMLLVLGFGESLRRLVSDWKRFHASQGGVTWQENFFDHRLREDERGEHLEKTVNYIRDNPVKAKLCTQAENWPWVYPSPPRPQHDPPILAASQNGWNSAA